MLMMLPCNLEAMLQCLIVITFIKFYYYRPGWRALLSEVVVKKDGGKLYGSDRLISLLYFEKGVTLGVWQVRVCVTSDPSPQLTNLLFSAFIY